MFFFFICVDSLMSCHELSRVFVLNTENHKNQWEWKCVVDDDGLKVKIMRMRIETEILNENENDCCCCVFMFFVWAMLKKDDKNILNWICVWHNDINFCFCKNLACYCCCLFIHAVMKWKLWLFLFLLLLLMVKLIHSFFKFTSVYIKIWVS